MKFNSERRKNDDCVKELSKELNTLRPNPVNPKQNPVKHIHHFHKHIWISITLFIISLLLAYGWTNCHSEKKVFEDNDIKYRFWKANGNTSLLKIIYRTDSLYNLDRDHFTNEVYGGNMKLLSRRRRIGWRVKRKNKPGNISCRQYGSCNRYKVSCFVLLF